ncbi:MAG: hypothetical protein U0798_08745 [Gemmataceae bacterium]
MGRWTRCEDPPDDFDEDDEYPHPDDIEYDPEEDDAFNEFMRNDSPEVPCPHCGETITEDHQRCPHCQLYITKEDEPREAKPSFSKGLFIVTAVCFILFCVLLFRGS